MVQFWTQFWAANSITAEKFLFPHLFSQLCGEPCGAAAMSSAKTPMIRLYAEAEESDILLHFHEIDSKYICEKKILRCPHIDTLNI